jgi:hypothetical protein
MYPKVVIDDLKDLGNAPELLGQIMPREAEIVEAEFRKEIRKLGYEEIGQPISEIRDVEIPSDEYVIRKSFIHGTRRESDLTGADVAVEIVGKKLFLCQAKKETIKWDRTGNMITSRRLEIDRAQMTTLIWFNDEILARIHEKGLPSGYPNVHPLSYRVPCFYKLIFLDASHRKPSNPGQVGIAEERYIPVRQAELILGSRKTAPAQDFHTGYLPEEFQYALASCDAGSDDLQDQNLKRKLFFEYASLSKRAVVHFHIQPK